MATADLHERTLAKSAKLSQYWNAEMISPIDVITVLNQAKISFVLVGLNGLVGWLHEARATEDVDVIVAAKQVKKAVKELQKAFPQLEAVDLPVVVRLKTRGTDDVAIDVMKPLQQPYREVFKHTVSVTSEGQTYRVPSLEMAAVMKFSAMTSPYRAPKDKFQDAHDFINIIESNPEIDQDKLTELARLIYPEAGKDILEYARKAKAGDSFSV